MSPTYAISFISSDLLCVFAVGSVVNIVCSDVSLHVRLAGRPQQIAEPLPLFCHVQNGGNDCQFQGFIDSFCKGPDSKYTSWGKNHNLGKETSVTFL